MCSIPPPTPVEATKNKTLNKKRKQSRTLLSTARAHRTFWTTPPRSMCEISRLNLRSSIIRSKILAIKVGCTDQQRQAVKLLTLGAAVCWCKQWRIMSARVTKLGYL